MPSPVGHALAGVAVGWLLDGRRPSLSSGGDRYKPRLDRTTLAMAAAYAFVAMMPDLDLLIPVTHRAASHGVGAAALAGIVAWGLTRRIRTALVFAVVYESHALLDWLGTDTTPPIGVMALWPFSREYFESPWQVFMAVSRRYWIPEFWAYNFQVVIREVLILAPLVIVTAIVRGRR